MRFAFRTHLHHIEWSSVLALWRAADEMPVFETAFLADHFVPTKGDPAGPCLEAWTALTALGQATSRLRVGTLVSSNTYRHPTLVANMAATLDHVTAGRLELGLGTGWSEAECLAYGIRLPPLKERFDAFDEACEVIIGLLSDPVSNFSGDHYRLSDARCEPKPIQRPHPPILIGGAGEKRALRSVARYAQHWNFRGGGLSELAHKREVLAAHCADIGRDVDDIRLSMQIELGDGGMAELRRTAEAYASARVDLAVITLPGGCTVEDLRAIAGAVDDLMS